MRMANMPKVTSHSEYSKLAHQDFAQKGMKGNENSADFMGKNSKVYGMSADNK